MAGECSTAIVPHGQLFAEDDLVGLLCARCGYTFHQADPLRVLHLVVTYDDQVVRRATILAHFDCRDPAGDRIQH